MKLLTILMPLVLCGVILTPITAQKFGHIDSAVLIESHPGVPGANSALEEFRKSVMGPFETKAKAFQSKYQFFLEEVQAGTISKVTAGTRQQDLQKEQQALATEEQQIQFSVMQKREELLEPILADIDSLIQQTGKEGKYTLIFDTSVSGALLYAIESDDLTEMLLGKLKEE
jgi:Skp family chaperone for outer membrane proteins